MRINEVPLDDRDRAILRLLQADGRLTNLELAQRINLSPSACLRRVKLLEESGLISRYVMLLNEKLAGLAHELHRHRLVVDIGLGAAVCRLLAAEDEVAVVVDTVVAQQRTRRMRHRHVEDRCHLAALSAVAHQRSIAAPAECQRKTVEKNGFAGARLTREHGKTRLERKVEPFDQDDIADR